EIKSLHEQLAAAQAGQAQVAQLAAETKALRERLAGLQSAPATPAPTTPASAQAGPVPPASPAEWTTDQKRAIQRALRVLGHYQGETDGGFGGGTQAAIKEFQSFAGAPLTGS